jgi:hypothetical protein
MGFLKIFDAYSLRARLFPAIIAAAPALAALALLISWKTFELSNAIATVAIVVLLFAIADLARARGRAIEPMLYKRQGGKPSIVMFWRNDPTIDDALKERYRIFLADQLGVAAPTAAQEAADQAAADAFYEQCGVWLRQHTRDTKKFHLLFGENVTYGFRRNLLGVRWLAIALNLIVVVICLVLLSRSNWNWAAPLGQRTIVVLLIAAVHAIYVSAVVRETAVNDASRAYGREMILSCESFLKDGPAPKPKPPTKRANRRK